MPSWRQACNGPPINGLQWRTEVQAAWGQNDQAARTPLEPAKSTYGSPASRPARCEAEPASYAYNTHMKAEFTAILEPAPEGGFWAICPEVPGANGQGETIEETKASLKAAIELLLEDRRADMLRGLPADAIQDKVVIG